MNYFYVFDRIAGTRKHFSNILEAKEEVERLMKIYLKLNSKVKMKKVNDNFYIDLKKE